MAQATRQQMRRSDAAAKRGDILDRRGQVLATSVDADSIYAVPSAIEDPRSVIGALCTAFGDCTAKERESLVEKLGKTTASSRTSAGTSRRTRRSAWRRSTSKASASSRRDRRFYPNKELAAHLLGYVGLDNQGLNGLETRTTRRSAARTGKVLVQTDARRRAFARVRAPPTAGSTVELTIDEYLQHIAERELHAGVVENRAAGGTAIIMDPHTGEILAMANDPTFNPNVVSRVRRKRPPQSRGPGSVRARLDVQGRDGVRGDRREDHDAGHAHRHEPRLHRGRQGRIVTESEGHNYSVLSFTDVIVESSNVGAIKIGFRVGAERMGRYVRLFGFGRAVSPDFPPRAPASCGSREAERQRARVGVYGISGGRHAAADGHGRQLGRQRRQYVEPRVSRGLPR